MATVGAGVRGLVDLTHPALADGLEDFVVSETSPLRIGHDRSGEYHENRGGTVGRQRNSVWTEFSFGKKDHRA